MPTYKTPGVYVEEISKLPPSVAEVSTAIPCFLGYTEKRPTDEPGPKIARINTLLEYEQVFGKAKPSKFKVTVSRKTKTDPYEIDSLQRDLVSSEFEFLLYYSLSLYFKNGGGPCYIVSVGNYDDTPNETHFEKGLELLKREDEPTLIVLTDAVELSPTDYYKLCQQALDQCNTLKDRFAIFDVLKESEDKDSKQGGVEEFRDKITSDYLMYGAAYLPYLQTTLTYQYEEEDVTITGLSDSSATRTTLASLRATNTALYNQIKAALGQQRVVLPPSAAVAGVYASVDRDRGVWKAPANVSISSVIGPVSKITNEDQDSLNMDPTGGGKSINAIRSFTGKGTLVWGARTLAGEDNEWRYIPVRRLFNLIEESTQKSTAFAVFEPNDATTWLKVKAMIESYLYGLWERGALAGSTPEASYFVNVGLGKTMTRQDILEGRMIVEIGVAAVRPTEFIILRFSHQMQQA